MNDQKIKSLKQTLEEDPKLAYSSNEERELRLKYPFSNVFIDFPTTGYSVSFPAYMKGLQDSFNPSFNAVDVFGRVDSIPVYQSTKRSINFTLTMPAYNESHAKEILRDINTIVKNLYPSYVVPKLYTKSGTRIINSPPLVRVKFANLICDYTNPSRGLLGYVNGSVNITHGIDTNGMFLIENGGDGVIFAKTYEMAFNLTVLHEDTPGFDENGNFIGSEQFPYQLDNSSANFFNEQSEGTQILGTATNAVSRLAGSFFGGTGTKVAASSNSILGGK